MKTRFAYAPLAVCAVVALVAAKPAATAAPTPILADRDAAWKQSLDGTWKFRYVPGSDAGRDEAFSTAGYDVAAWRNIAVPGHWELQGFAEPKYADDLAEGLGLYRRAFRVAKEWDNRRVFLRFDGVLFGFTVWVNGQNVGEWASGFNPVTFDITDALKRGEADNELAVRVTTRSRGWGFDTMDCWSLSGIYRNVTLFALPAVHLSDYTARTVLKPDGSAELQLELVATSAATVAGRLIAPDGTTEKDFQVALGNDGRGATRLGVEHPQLWTAESPRLYRVEFDLKSGDTTLQRFGDRIGLRQVTLDSGIFKLNGTPVKLRGIDHHDIWPEEGRVATEERMRRDLELMRAANINFVRTSHYPPHPRLIELCDELGIYVDCEVPFIHGREHHNDPTYQDALLTRARATVMRDKNRPSVILWSIGNENHITELGLNTGKLVKQLDPTRPITYPTMGSYFRPNFQNFPELVDLYSPHYPSAGTVKDYAERLMRPIVVTEYAHQRGIARGGAGVQEIWETMYRSPRVAGGAIWLFQDQGILRTAPGIKDVENGDLMVWLDEHRYYDTHGYYGVDGIVYSDRTPQADYWQVRKVYSPVQIQERALAVLPGSQNVTLHVENRHDFRSLTGMKLQWALRKNGAPVQNGVVALAAPPRETETVSVGLTLPAALGDDVFALELQCIDETGRSLYERSLRLDAQSGRGARVSALFGSLPPSAPELEVSEQAFVVRHTRFRLNLDRRTGQLTITDPSGIALLSAFGPHTARKLTINDLGKKREGEATHWQGELLREVAALTTTAETNRDGIVLKVGGRYPRPGFPQQAVEGACEFRVRSSGAVEVSYRYTPVNAKDAMVEAGLAFSLPSALSEFRWVGEGPYAGYPGKDRLNEFGLFHLNRDDIYFPGNRRRVELALLASAAGAGIMIAGDQLTVSVENRDTETVFSHLALVPGQTSDRSATGENVENKAELKASSIKAIAGDFTLLPLTNEWPALLAKWFGPHDRPAQALRPFLRSYDQ